MQVQCPECETKFVVPEPGEVTCPACMTTFDCRPEPEPAHAYRIHAEQRGLDLQIPEGGVHKNVSRYALREGIYVGRYKNGVRWRKGDGTWEHVGTLPEIAAIFRMTGQEPLPAPATRAIAGWRGTPGEEAEPVGSSAQAAVSGALSASGNTPGSAPGISGGNPGRAAGVTGGRLALLAALVAALVAVLVAAAWWMGG